MQKKRKKQKLKDINIENKSNDFNESNDKDLMSKICENNVYFSSLIDLIPPKIYFEGNEEILESIEMSKNGMFSNESELSVKTKHKRFKLDPNNDKKVSQIANQFYSNSNGKQSNNNNNKINKIEELKQKLNERITQLKSIRGGRSDAKKCRESKKQRRRENAMRASKQKGFVKSVAISEDNSQQKDNHKNKKQKRNQTHNNSNIEDKSVVKTDQLPKIYNKEGNLVFSKFDFVSPLVESDVKHKKKKPLNKLLVKAKRDEQKLSQLEEKDRTAAKLLKDKKLWRNAIEKSEGNKVRDNSKLIEKSLNKKKKIKIRSSKKWKERNESLEQKMKSKDDKRKRNIDERRKQMKDRKISKARKKGRIINGK